ncbi:TetR family transcriptional regulator [Streptomyces sp. DSM 42041]|uniref:TetR family transcriptional regulator n=1 Tax=Streptomyces hazeniae TaxID=3075538 RepID=A0ABU2P245_9ACTN|nr:TetR family transcriptional regulator [Streptomyces sp. DSM 42041]MDT0382523.1 TetR family transcriptional regulator [Streptomyces sp. DSM 42041]
MVAAARKAIVLHGLSAVRIRDVADTAGMAPGSVTYYFRELDELFQEVFTDAVERFSSLRRAAVQDLQDPRDRLVATIRAGLPTGPDDELCCLLYEFAPQARKNTRDAALRRTLYDDQVDLYCELLSSGEADDAFRFAAPAREIASNLVALEDAYGYHIIAGTSVTRATAEQYLIGYAATATGARLRTN